jgi:hypothetical protein
MQTDQASQTSQRRITTIVAAIYIAVLALDIWLIFFLAGGSWQGKAAFLLQTLGLYSFAIGFVSQSELSNSFSKMLENMTSSNLRDFLGENMSLLTVVSGLQATMAGGKLNATGWHSHVPLVPWVITIMALVGELFYVIVVMPIAYVAYLLAAIPLLLIRDSKVTAFIGEKGSPKPLNVQELVKGHMVALKAFMVGLASTAVSFVINGVSLYLGEIAAKFV